MSGPSQADRPELVDQLSAYLDGELDAETTRRIEELLATDPNVRMQLQRLEQAWDCLERLPRAEVEASFTQSTVEMIAVSAAEEVSQERVPGSGRRLFSSLTLLSGLALLAGFALAAGLGFLLVWRLEPRPNDELVRDLPILENLEAYRQVGSMEFLQALSRQGLFKPLEKATTVVAETEVQRRARIEGLAPADKEHLLRRQERFEQVDPAEQVRLRELANNLTATTDGSQLIDVMQRYHAWLATLPPMQRAELMQLPSDERLKKVASLQAAAQAQDARQLGAADLRVMSEWIEQLVTKNLPQPIREKLEQMPPQERHRAVVRTIWQRSQSLEPGNWPPQLKDGDFQHLREQLSPAARQQIALANTPEDKRRLIADWFQQCVRGYWQSQQPGAWVSEERLKRFFESELSESERQQLLALPSDEFQRQLRRTYYIRVINPTGQRGFGLDNPSPGRQRPRFNPNLPAPPGGVNSSRPQRPAAADEPPRANPTKTRPTKD
jgi:hypothetical protein